MYNRFPLPTRSLSRSFPAPAGGVNDIDPVSAMGEQFQIDSMNFFMDTGMPVVRPGYREWATEFGKPVETIVYFNSRAGDYTPFAVTSSGLYDISVSTDSPTVAQALTNGQVQFTNFSNAQNNYLIVCNGTDPVVMFDGSTWTTWVSESSPSAPGEIDGVNPNRLMYPMAHKHRLWFIEKGTMTAWYMPLDAVGGTATPFYLGGVFTRGGNLMAMARWSSDTGRGLDDRLVFISSAGEIAVYAGDDPNEAESWRLESVFFVAPPVSNRSTAAYGGDVLYMTRRGLVPLSSLIAGQSMEVLFSGALTRRISRTLLKLTSDPAPPFPGEVMVHNDLGWLMINLFDSGLASKAPYDLILSPGNNQPIQLVMNVLTGAWGKFNIPMRTMCSVGGRLFMGTTDGRVLLLTPGVYLDDVKIDGSGGQPIDIYAMGAFTYLGDSSNNKHVKFIRPTIQSEVRPAIKMRVVPNFQLNRLEASPSAAPVSGGPIWDVSSWDEINWGGSANTYRPWISANVLGHSFAWQLRGSTASSFGLTAVDYVWEQGGYV